MANENVPNQWTPNQIRQAYIARNLLRYVTDARDRTKVLWTRQLIESGNFDKEAIAHAVVVDIAMANIKIWLDRKPVTIVREDVTRRIRIYVEAAKHINVLFTEKDIDNTVEFTKALMDLDPNHPIGIKSLIDGYGIVSITYESDGDVIEYILNPREFFAHLGNDTSH